MASIITLSATEVNEVVAPSTRYSAAAYDAVVARLAKGKKLNGLGAIETEFPGVNPAHVAHMLKQRRGDDFIVEISAVYGVCLMRKSAVKPANVAPKAKVKNAAPTASTKNVAPADEA